MSFSFKDLDLSKVEEETGPNSLYIGVGKHEVKITDAAVEQCSNPKHYRVRVNFADKDERTIRNDFNVKNESAKAVEIGMSQFKSLLVSAKHPNPDKPDDVTSLKGLKVMIDVKLGKKKEDGSQYPEVKGYEAVGETLGDDEIPF